MPEKKINSYHWLIRFGMVIGLFSFGCLVVFLMKHTIPFEIQSLLSPNHPVRLQYEKDIKNFSDESSNWVAVERDKAFTPLEIQSLSNTIGRALDMNPGLDQITGPHNAKYIHIQADRIELVPFLKNGQWTENALESLKSEMWKNNLIREDFTGFLFNFKILQNLPRQKEKPALDQLSSFLNRLETQNPGIRTALLGTKVASAHFLEEMHFQQRILTPILLLAICLFFYFCYRSVQIVLWSLFTIFVCYVSTLCLIMIVEKGLGPYSTFALMFTFIVATTDLIHFFSRFQQLDGTVEERLKKTLEIAWLPCLLTTLTTTAGFLSLIINQNLPVRYFGLYCAFGCLMEWFVIFYLLPPILKAFNFNPKQHKFHADQFSEKFQSFLNSHTKLIVFTSFALIIFGVIFSSKLKVDDNFYTKFNEKHPLSQALNTFSKGFDFVGSIDMVITPTKPQENIFNQEVFDEIRKVENDLESHPKVSRLNSLRQINDELDRQMPATLSRAEKDARINSLLHLMNNYGVIHGNVSESLGAFRTSIFLRSMATEDLDSVLGKIDELKLKYQDSLDIRASGFSVVRSFINSRVIKDFFESFFLSFFLIFLCYWWLYKSPKWAFYALIPNTLPLLSVSAFMGLFSSSVDTNLVILICITFGVSGDNTIHLSYVIQEEQRRGLSYDAGLKKALRLIGVAMIATSGVFLFCLPIFLLGNLRLFGQIAIYLSIAFIMAFLADIIMFPAIQKLWGWNFHPGDLAKTGLPKANLSQKDSATSSLDIL